MERGSLLWCRHEGEIQVNEETVISVLSSIPDTLPVADTILWMKETFLPSLIKHCPHTMQHITQWITDTARSAHTHILVFFLDNKNLKNL